MPTWSAVAAWPVTRWTGSSTPSHQTFAVPNLYLADGSVLPTQGSANPALTIMALAARCADGLIDRPAQRETRRDAAMTRPAAPITAIASEAYRVPTDGPEADGTLEWDSTTMIVARVSSGDHEGIGWTYAGRASQAVIDDTLSTVVMDGDAFAIPALHERMARAVRNLGRPGAAACALSAVDIALWDLKAKLLDLPLCDLWGRARPTAPI